jgi:BirA family transcriptional regulator, biotin operon repressor / biotin---[acetyl-CoA-carboxylase] ligase
MAVRESNRKPAGAQALLPLEISKIRDLRTTRIGTKFHYFPELDSTNSSARRLAEQGAGAGEIVLAEQQTQGRGRLGRNWISPPYLNLYLSVVLRPTLPPAHAPQITLMAAVALADTIASFLPFPPAIKWPNDIIVGGKKAAGILTESSCQFDRIEFVILGMGINLNFPENLMPEAIRHRATSLLIATGYPVRRELFLERLIQDLDRCYGTLEERGFGAIAPRWEARFGLKERRVRIDMTDGVIFGTARGIDRDGALIVESGDGELRRVLAGDVIPIED